VILNHGSSITRIRRPFEIFINSKTWSITSGFQPLNADYLLRCFARVVIALSWSKELRSVVFDPKGGYMKRGGRWMPSLVAEIGDVLDAVHLSVSACWSMRSTSPKNKAGGRPP